MFASAHRVGHKDWRWVVGSHSGLKRRVRTNFMNSFISATSQRAADSLSVADLSRLLAGDSCEGRRTALDALTRLDDAIVTPHVPVVLERLCDDDELTCFAAANVLNSLPSAAIAPHATAIMALFETVPASSRWRVVEVLSKLDATMLSEHVDGIRRLLGHADSDVRRRAVELLGTLPDVEANAAFALPCLEDKDEDCRLSAVELLGKLAPEALAPHLNAVVKRLQDEEECVRMGAVVVIGTLPAATIEPFTATMLSMLEDPSWRVRRHAMEVSVPLHADGLPHWGPPARDGRECAIAC